MMIERDLKNIILKEMRPNKAILIYGARRVGKTVLIKQIASEFKGRTTFLNGEEMSTEMMFKERTAANYRQILGDTDLLIIDEAQNIPDIGKILKLIVDEVKGIHVIASGSSSFDLRNKAGEPLVGRSFTYRLSPISVGELAKTQTNIAIMQSVEDTLLYGTYPELFGIESSEQKRTYLTELAQSYLLKDILNLDGIKNSSKMYNLLRLVSMQVGSEVSYEEIGKTLSLSRNTVEKYLDLLSKAFVVYRLPAFSRNPRNEVSKAGKWFFFDNGIRNAVIGDFRPIALRQDVGALWENFLVSERIKMNDNKRRFSNHYFWRTYSGQEIDLIEENNGVIGAFEFKWGKKTPKVPSSFHANYPDAAYQVVSRSNFVGFCSGDDLNSSTK